MLSGRRLDLLNPHPDDIAIDDIARGLARVARWNGQTSGPHIFSVAQHSLLVEALVAETQSDDSRIRLAALLHDAPEYVVGDLISPFKTVLGDTYRTVEHRLLAAIHTRFDLGGLPAEAAAMIKQADRAAARLEATLLAGFSEPEANLFFGPALISAEDWRSHVLPQPSDQVQATFLLRFGALRPGAA